MKKTTFKVRGKEYSRAEMRVLIAKDVLKMLKAKTVVPTRGVYVKAYRLEHDLSKVKNSRVIAQRIKKSKNCEVCALGACLLSAVSLTNNFQFNLRSYFESNTLTIEQNEITPKLLEFFSPFQLALMEAAFERRVVGHSHVYSQDLKTSNKQEAAINAASRVFDDEMWSYQPGARLTVIMENIVKNGGTFRPSQIKNQLP